MMTASLLPHHDGLIPLHTASREVPLAAARGLGLLHHEHPPPLHHHPTHYVAHVVEQLYICMKKVRHAGWVESWPGLACGSYKHSVDVCIIVSQPLQLSRDSVGSTVGSYLLICVALTSGLCGWAVGWHAARAHTSSIPYAPLPVCTATACTAARRSARCFYPITRPRPHLFLRLP